MPFNPGVVVVGAAVVVVAVVVLAVVAAVVVGILVVAGARVVVGVLVVEDAAVAVRGHRQKFRPMSACLAAVPANALKVSPATSSKIAATRTIVLFLLIR